MPDVSRIYLGLRMGVFSNDTEALIDTDDDMAGVAVEFSGEADFTTYDDDDLTLLATDIGNEASTQVFASLLAARTQLREALEEIETIEMFQNQEPDWEV